jgi:hypothetical protein
MPGPRRIEGFAIVSEDGMLANAEGIMPDSLKFEADRQFFECGLDGVNVVVHGRHSHERQPRSHLRHRLILTRQVPAIAGDPSNEKALFWNPAGASFERKPWLCSGRQTAALASSAVRRCSGCSWTDMTFSTCRGRQMCDCPVGEWFFPRWPRGLRRRCLQATASTAASGRCLMRQKAS